MKPWMRYGIVVAVLVWAFGNIPAWLLMPTYRSHGRGYAHQVSYAVYYSLAPLFVLLGCCCIAVARLMGPELMDWLGQREYKETRAERIARLERELGIGQE